MIQNDIMISIVCEKNNSKNVCLLNLRLKYAARLRAAFLLEIELRNDSKLIVFELS